MEATPELVIREATPRDLTTIRDFQVAMAFESEKMRLNPDTCLRGVEAVLKDPTKGSYWIACFKAASENTATNPVACILIQKEWSDWRARTVLWIHSLYVTPENRGKGIYKQVYRFFQSRVKSDPTLGGLRLYVDKTNETAIRVYEKLGMTREHYHLYEWMP